MPPPPPPPGELPSYPIGGTTKSVAHDATLAFDASTFAGQSPAQAPGRILISNVTVHQGQPGHGGGLVLHKGTVHERAIKSGDLIEARDFAHLSWDAATNEGGSFRFVPLDPNGQPIPGVPEQHITVQEAPQPPDYTEPSIQFLVNDRVQGLDAGLFRGGQPERAPAHVRIEAITPTDDGGTPALYHFDDSKRLVAVQAGDTLSAEQYARLHWDSRDNRGGTIRFTPLDAAGQPIEGSDSHTITLSEDPQLPVYAAQPAPLAVAHDGPLKIDPLRLTGTDISRKPDYVRITAIDAEGDTGQQPALIRQLPPASDAPTSPGTPVPTEPLVVGSVIPFAAFRHLVWDASGNTGGSFRFVPAAADGRALAGAAEQTVQIVEHPAPPQYPDTQPLQAVAHDGTLDLSAGLFTGTDPQRQPSHIRITAITPARAQGDHDALVLDPDGTAGPASAGRVTVGQIIPLADLGKLQWQAAGNQGGGFSFVPVLADGTPILGAAAQTIIVRESPVPPRYNSVREHHVAHDEGHSYGREEVFGTWNFARFVRIESIQENADGQPDSSPLTLHRRDGSSTPVQDQDVIAVQGFDRLHWSTQHNEGGRFRIVPLDRHQHPIVGAEPIDYTILECPPVPVYPDAETTLSVAQDQILSVPRTLLAGTDASREPAFVRIEQIDESADTEQARSALFVDQGAKGPRLLGHGDVVAHADFGQLRWDSSTNEGGTFRFVPLGPGEIQIIGAPAQTIHIQESAPVPTYDSPAQTLQADFNQVLSIDPAVFRGTVPGNAPAAVRITALDETTDTTPARSALYIDHGNGTTTELTVGARLSRADFDKVRWDAASTQGGRFVFEALDASHQPIPGAARTITIDEAAPPAGLPSFPATPPEIGVAHHGKLNLPAWLFAGDNPATPAAAIKITSVSDRKAGFLLFDADGDGPKKAEAATRPRKIDAANFDKLTWDASKTTGDATITFQVLDSTGTPLAGVGKQTIQIYESPPVPSYGGLNMLGRAEPNQPVSFDESVLGGNDPSRFPPRIRITRIDEYSDSTPDQSALYLKPGPGSSVSVVTPVKVGQIISRSDFAHLGWDTAQNRGGSFQFIGLDDKSRPIIGLKPVTVSAIEKPSYDSNIQVTVAHDQMAPISPDIFMGSDGTPTGRIRFADPQVEYDDTHNGSALALDLGNGQYRELKFSDVIEAADFHRIRWNAGLNTGGKFTFTPLDEHGRYLLGGSHTVSVQVIEAPPAAPGSTSRTGKGAADAAIPGHETGAPTSGTLPFEALLRDDTKDAGLANPRMSGHDSPPPKAVDDGSRLYELIKHRPEVGITGQPSVLPVGHWLDEGLLPITPLA